MTKTPHFSLTPEWPRSFPEHCHDCHNAYDPRFSLDIGPSRVGRFLKKIAPWFALIMLIVLGVTGMGIAGMGAVIATLLPAIAVHITGSLFPVRARLYCHKCGRKEFLRLPETWS